MGGSAGGLPALLAVLENLDSDAALAVVVVLHLAPDQESHAAEILQRATSMVVVQVKERTLLKAGHVYVIAPGTNLITDDGHLQPRAARTQRPSQVIDLFFRSLGEVHRERAVGVVLSGTGKDGSLGITRIKECGGCTIAQAPEDCEHEDMPRAALATGAIDLSLPAAEIGPRLVALARSALSDDIWPAEPAPSVAHSATAEPSPERALRDVLNLLRLRTRHDFRHYKRATLERRLERRMRVHGLRDIQAYADLVRKNPEELTSLLADLLISVTQFFRDPLAFEALQTQVVPQILDGVAEGEELRVWIPACASGEESYSVAIALQEYADRMVLPPRMLLFASDINEAALAVARAGVYPDNIATDLSQERLLGYFDKEDGELLRVRGAIRDMIVFARHNVLSDPPFSRLDLISCRNLLIYLDTTAQAAAIEMFAYALKPGGYLFLGNTESVDVLSSAFETVNKEQRIYRLRPEAGTSMRVRMPSQVDLREIGPAAPAPLPGQAMAPREPPAAALHERALVAAAPPSVLVNALYELERVSVGAGRFVAFGAGAPSRNLLNNVASDIRVELRTALFRANELRRPVHSVFQRERKSEQDPGPVMTLSIHPVRGGDSAPLHWLVLFDEQSDRSVPLPKQEGGSQVHAPLHLAIERLEEENRSLKGHLQQSLDRSAVSTEELKASNEELQAINEELRSAKEELETSREELQSLNEELSTVNFELRMKVEEAGRNNDDLRNLIEASEIATVFVDPSMRIKRFTPQATQLFALIPADVGRPLMDIKSRLNYDEIVQDATAVFRHLRPIKRSLTTVEGAHFFARILPYRTSADKIGGAVLTFIDVSELRRAEDKVRQTEERLRDAVAASKDFAVLSADARGLITSWNEGAARMFGYAADEIMGRAVDLLFTPEDRAAGAPESERSQALREGRASDERWHLRKDGSIFFCSGVMTLMQSGLEMGFLKIARDVSESKGREIEQRTELHKAQSSTDEARHASEAKDRFLAVMSHELKQPLNLIHVNAELLVRLPEVRELTMVQRIGGTILRAVDAQETIVNDLLDLSRMQTGKLRLHLETLDLGQLVRQLGQAIAQDAQRKSISLQVETAPEELPCHCDRVRIEQVVWNLLGNALKFTPEHGKISVKLTAVGDHAKLEVKDNGIGISAQALPTIFELFSQAETGNPGRAGLGIGLALVRELVQAHAGRIHATSPGEYQGATFSVWIPLGAQAPCGVSAAADVKLQRRILMVDDDADSLSVFSALLRMEGASVDTTVHPAEALQMLAAGDYDLLLSDIGMPAMSGLELMSRARALRTHKTFRCIAISGFGREVDVQAALDAGFDAHLSKPISLERLRSVLRRLGA